MARPEEYTRRALEPFLDHFYAAALAGVRDGRTLYPETGHVHRKTTTRSITRDHIVDNLRGKVDGQPRMRIRDGNQTTYFVIDGEFEVLVKKATEDGLVVLNDTQAALDFQCNLEPDLFDYDKTNLYLSYVENDNDPLNPNVFLICPSAAGYHWMFEIMPPAGEIGGEIVAPQRPDVGGDNLIKFPVIKKTDEESE
jgi:hypothetical protein